jgi:hypothetical protein
MLTRRAVLTGTAAASIAAIASARGVEAAAPPKNLAAAFGGCGYGNLNGGAVAVFHKDGPGFNAFMKFDEMAADVFFKETAFSKVEVFFKFFHKGWSSLASQVLDKLTSLDKAEAYFDKVAPDGANFVIKSENDLGVFAKIEANPDGGLQLVLTEVSPQID